MNLSKACILQYDINNNEYDHHYIDLKKGYHN
jgi:hypothetical protein